MDAKSDSGTRASDLVASHVSWDQVFGGLSGPLMLSLGNHQYHARCTKTFNSSDGPSKTLPCKSCVVLWYGRLVVDAFSKALPPASVKVMLFASTLGLGLNVE